MFPYDVYKDLWKNSLLNLTGLLIMKQCSQNGIRFSKRSIIVSDFDVRGSNYTDHNMTVYRYYILVRRDTVRLDLNPLNIVYNVLPLSNRSRKIG